MGTAVRLTTAEAYPYNTLMNTTLLASLAPMILMAGLGFFAARLKLLSAQEVNGLKKLVSGILLPFLVFSSLCTLKLDFSALLVMALSMVFQMLLYGLGFLTAPKMGEYGKYHRFIICTSELGMLGYVLFMSLFGTENLGYMTLLDAGQMLFFFCIVMPDLQRTASGRANSPLQALFRSPVLWALFLGLACNLTGLYEAVTDTAAGAVLTSCLDMVTTPVSGIMLFVIGFGISIDKEILKPVLKTSALRLGFNVLLSFAAAAVILWAGADRLYVWAFLLYGVLPSTYLATAYVQEEKLGKHINTVLSLYTLFTLLAAGILYVISR